MADLQLGRTHSTPGFSLYIFSKLLKGAIVEHNVNFPDKDRIKAHWNRNKKLYLGIGIGVAIGLVIRRPMVISITPVIHNSAY